MIERIRCRLPAPPAGHVWAGDDAAVVAAPSGCLVLTADLVIEGIHADLALVGLDDLGWKALAVNVSDIAAMGGVPSYALVSVAVPVGCDYDLDILYAGLQEATDAFKCPIVGGDLSATTGPLVVSVTVTGDMGGDMGTGEGRAAPGPVLRSGASAGDAVFVTGPLGASAAGLRLLRTSSETAKEGVTGSEGRGAVVAALITAHRRPRPRLTEGVIARAAGASAMIDLSDGLATDLRHVVAESGVGVALDAIPIAEGATFAEALGGGEDYELLFAAPDPEAVEAAFAGARLPVPLRIGRCTEEVGELRLGDSELPTGGWEHAWR